MKFKNTLLVVTIIILTSAQAQTKWIFHKSHSGANHTLFADAKNNFGPGMVFREPIAEKPVSKIELKYKKYNDIKYPIVKLDSASKTMRYIDVNDSLIGCDRSFKEYLTVGSAFYDLNSGKYILFQNQHHNSSDFIFVTSPEEFEKWANYKDTQSFPSHIFSGDYERILIVYPYSILKPRVFATEKESVPAVLETTPKKELIKIVTEPESIQTIKPSKIESIKIEDKPNGETFEKGSFIVAANPIINNKITTAMARSKTPLYVLGLLLFIAITLGLKLRLRKI